jgi:hypothetical protein
MEIAKMGNRTAETREAEPQEHSEHLANATLTLRPNGGLIVW